MPTGPAPTQFGVKLPSAVSGRSGGTTDPELLKGRGLDVRELVGVSFRLHGRDPETGLDCVGVAALAFGVAAVPRGYSVRTADGAGVAQLIDAAGLRQVRREPVAGDLVLVRSGPAQCHLVVMTDAGFVHADAGFGRVVETPGALPWPVLAVWEG